MSGQTPRQALDALLDEADVTLGEDDPLTEAEAEARSVVKLDVAAELPVLIARALNRTQALKVAGAGRSYQQINLDNLLLAYRDAISAWDTVGLAAQAELARIAPGTAEHALFWLLHRGALDRQAAIAEARRCDPRLT